MVSGVVLVVVFPKEEEDGFCSSNANSFCACTPILVAKSRIIRNNRDETTANVIVRAFILRIVVIILSLLNNACVIFDGSLEFCCVLKPYLP
jgi:hypothetical protein